MEEIPKTDVKSEVAPILNALSSMGVTYDLATCKKHGAKGFNSDIYEINTEEYGLLILHVATATHEHTRNKVWNKLKGISELLANDNTIPTSLMLTAFPESEKYFTAQTYIPGQVVGERTITDTDVVDVWFPDNRESIVNNLERLTAHINLYQVPGYGWPKLVDGRLMGEYKSWHDFLRSELEVWLKTYSQIEKRSDFGQLLKLYPAEYVRTEALKLIDQTLDLPAVLVHHDSANPANIVTEQEKINGIIDWEWAIFAPFTFELAEPGWSVLLETTGLDNYFSAMGISVNERKRYIDDSILLRVFLWLHRVHTHHKNTNRQLACLCASQFVKKAKSIGIGGLNT